MSAASAKSRLLAATLSCTLGFGVLTASAVGYWYSEVDGQRRAAELVEATRRGEDFVETTFQALQDRTRIAASIVAQRTDRGASFAMHQLRTSHPAAWILLADLGGKVLATSREQGPRESLLGLQGVRNALKGREARALWLFPEGAWLVALAPVRRDGVCTGVLALGERLDESFVRRLEVASGTPVWLSLGQRVLASNPKLVDAGAQVLPRLTDTSGQRIIDSRFEPDTVARGVLEFDDGALMHAGNFVGAGGRVAYYASTADSVMQIPWWRIFLLGLLGVVAGLINWQRLAGGLIRILDRLVYGLFEAGEGRLEAEIDFEGERGYFNELASAYRRMQHELRQRIDGLTRAAEHREQAIQAKDKFLASISHELRTPLTSVRAYAELLLQFSQEGRSEEEIEFLRIIQGESERLTRLIDDVLDLTRIEARTMQWNVERFDLRDLTHEVIDRLESKIAFKSIRVVFDPGYDSYSYSGDRRRLGQRLEHILDNAIKFSPVGGEVRISLSQMLTSFELRVEDSGPGVAGDAEKIAIFEKFYQRGEALTDRPDGTGLGLALTREILEAHAGTVFCEDAASGGAAFVVRMSKAGECRRDVDHGDENAAVADAFALWQPA